VILFCAKEKIARARLLGEQSPPRRRRRRRQSAKKKKKRKKTSNAVFQVLRRPAKNLWEEKKKSFARASICKTFTSRAQKGGRRGKGGGEGARFTRVSHHSALCSRKKEGRGEGKKRVGPLREHPATFLFFTNPGKEKGGRRKKATLSVKA